MSATTKQYLSHPDAAAGISRQSSGGAAWSYSGWTEVIPANHITADCWIAGLTWMWHTPINAADTTIEVIIELWSGADAALIIQIPCSYRADTAVGYVPSNMIIFPEPKLLAANTRVSVRIAYSTATTSNTISGIKILYQLEA